MRIPPHRSHEGHDNQAVALHTGVMLSQLLIQVELEEAKVQLAEVSTQRQQLQAQHDTLSSSLQAEQAAAQVLSPSPNSHRTAVSALSAAGTCWVRACGSGIGCGCSVSPRQSSLL